ncbi:MAG TPA: hypothetical protein VMR65_05485 [Candidatus Sulfotelmatobacter sp.]|nr:hypothetical protein [Candidatus Sulfotelmatobacter sp.]
MGATGQVGSTVVARFRDGRIMKGTVQNFLPTRPLFHLYTVDGNSQYGIAVALADLKALFFVKSFEGNQNYVEDSDVTHAEGAGRKIVVTFMDGEVLTGVTTGYSASKPGFFVTPTDPMSNNDRVYVVAKSVQNVAWAEAAIATPVGAPVLKR